MTFTTSTPYMDVDEHLIMTQETKRLHRYEDIISKETGNMFRLINLSVLATAIALFGICTNTINMIVFYRQGFNTNTNISFFALAISDVGCLVTAQWFSIAFNPYIEAANYAFIIEEVQYLSGGWLHVCCGRITSWITVFITAERCVGITLPLKVKQIITLRRTTIVIILIFVINLATLLPEYVIAFLDWKFVPARNRSLFGLVYRSYKDTTYGLVYSLTSASGFLSFISVILLTTFLVTKLDRKSKWRNKVTSASENSEIVSSRDKKTVKMIIMIASVLIVCNIPGAVISLASSLVPEFMISQALSSSCYASWSIAFVFDTINSSINVFLYYRMSTKYRQTFDKLFCVRANTK